MKKSLIIILLLGLIVSCMNTSETNFNGSDITQANLNPNFELTDHTGNKKSLIDFQGKVVALFFGFTHCPDICPTTMQELKLVKARLGDQHNNFQVLFITLDPERDTVEILKEYIPSFDSSFIGLTGNKVDIVNITRQYKVYAQKVGDGGDYTIDHSSGIYIIDKEGKIRVRHPYGATPLSIAEDILRLI
jgi:protein SCO1/2